MNLLTLFYVAVQDTTDSLTVAAPSDSVLNWWTWDMITKGGWIMVPILLLSLVTIWIFIERWRMVQRAARPDTQALIEMVRGNINAGDVRNAIANCERDESPIGRILKVGLERLGRPIDEIEAVVEAAGKQEAFTLEKRLDILASAAGIAPMLGLLGTVTGMISAFQEIQDLQGNVNPSVLAGGIWEALVTTAFGLGVGILAYFFYNLLLSRINRLTNDLELSSAQFIDMLQTPASTRF